MPEALLGGEFCEDLHITSSVPFVTAAQALRTKISSLMLLEQLYAVSNNLG